MKKPNPLYDPALDDWPWMDSIQLAERMCVVPRTALFYMRKLHDEGYHLVRVRHPRQDRGNRTGRTFLRIHVAATPDLEDAIDRWTEGASAARSAANDRRWAEVSPEERSEQARTWQRGVGPRRDYKGEAHNLAVLTEDNVRDLRAKREDLGWTYRRLSAFFGVGVSHVARIVHREAWSHVI